MSQRTRCPFLSKRSEEQLFRLLCSPLTPSTRSNKCYWEKSIRMLTKCWFSMIRANLMTRSLSPPVKSHPIRLCWWFWNPQLFSLILRRGLPIKLSLRSQTNKSPVWVMEKRWQRRIVCNRTWKRKMCWRYQRPSERKRWEEKRERWI